MAEIPIEKNKSFPWWLLLLGAALLGLLLFMFAAGDDDADVDAVAYNDNPAYAVNGSVDLDEAYVTELTGDMSFYARADNGETYFVVFDEVPTPGTATEGMLDINKGDYVDITGTMRGRDFTMPATVDADIPSGEEMFVFATNIEKD